MTSLLDVAIIDYQAGNLRSCSKAFQHVLAQDSTLKGSVRVVHHADDLSQASHIVLPGQGAFADCMHNLQRVDGMIEALNEAVWQKGKAFFGICVGMQLLADKGLEFGEHKGLGWIPGQVVAMEPKGASPNGAGFKIPHMGWNNLSMQHDCESLHPLMKGLTPGDHAYFVHSYHFQTKEAKHVQASVDFGGPITAIVASGPCFGTQFHPEKSQAAGLKLIRNFMGWCP